jgi:thiol-disulfide isomerase/thioredoxin
VLTTIAGRAYLAGPGTAAARAGFDGLRRCEDVALPKPPPAPRAPATAATFPPLEDEQRVMREVVPGWMGIAFDDLPTRSRARRNIAEGAATVTALLPDSPAQAAGLHVGDLVLGPPGHPFTDQGDIKAWTMLLPVDKPTPLEVLRAGKHLTVSLTPRLRPVTVPQMGAPRVATPAPPLYGATYRGAAPQTIAARGPFLLLFWATWCAPCKESLPEAMALARARHLPIVAVTDEGRPELDAFFAHWKRPFPENVVSDEDRLSFASYGVSGTPTIVLVDETHRVAAYTVGYTRERGLPVAGWHWDGK